CLFSMHGGRRMRPDLQEHINNGGVAVVYEEGDEGHIVLHAEERRLPLLGAHQIPATLQGAVQFNIQNALAAAAIGYGLGIDDKKISAGLASFTSSFRQNPGRFNVFDGHGFRVIVDYAHNPAALSALLNAARHMRGDY